WALSNRRVVSPARGRRHRCVQSVARHPAFALLVLLRPRQVYHDERGTLEGRRPDLSSARRRIQARRASMPHCHPASAIDRTRRLPPTRALRPASARKQVIAPMQQEELSLPCRASSSSPFREGASLRRLPGLESCEFLESAPRGNLRGASLPSPATRKNYDH